MKVESSQDTETFLAGGGEMGALIRAKDWSASPLGSISEWPQTLRITLSILLNSKFPMFLWWEEELIQFYNDAYRPSFGDEGKHPVALGQKAVDCWPEIWPFIKPLIDSIRAGGEAIWHEDRLVPIYRNGRLEDVYWTFSYSPIKEENGRVAGILVVCNETTEKVDYLKKAEYSSAQFQNMVLQAPVAMCVLKGEEFVVEIANERVLELWGKTPAEVMGKPIFEGLPEAGAQGLEDLLDHVFTSGERFIANERPVNLPRRGKTETTYINFVYEALREADGRISGIMVVAIDVTGQVIARKNAEEAEERARLAVEASQLGIWDYNPLTEELNFDEATKAMFEHDPDAPVTLNAFWIKMHPDDRESSLQRMLSALDPAIPDNYSTEYRIVLADQKTRWIQATGKAFFNEDKIPYRFSGTVVDITDRKNAEEELRLTNERFRLLADSMPQFVWTANTYGDLNYFNQAVFDFSGLTNDQIAQDGWIEIVHPDEREMNIEKWAHSILTGKEFFFEHRFRRHDGEYRWQLSRAIPQKDDHGIIQLWVGTSTDIHDQKMFAQELENQVFQRTKELKQSNEDLVRSNSELAQFAYVASHDLQEPLRKIQTFAARILEKELGNLSETGKDYFQRMQNSAKRMKTLIEDLLSYSRTNTAERDFQPTDLDKVLEEVKSEFREIIQEKNAVIESSGLGTVEVIPFQFYQLLHNLISNALKFSDSQRPPHITVQSEIAEGAAFDDLRLLPEKTYCHISVADNGVGFEPQYSERIFVVFQKLHGKDEYEGTGIGLAIVKKIVENHDGIITAAGRLGQGARFDIYIPA